MENVVGREIHLVSRPSGMPEPSNFALVTREVKEPGPDEVLVKNLFMSVDPYMRGRMRDAPSYVPPYKLGEALDGGSVGEVLVSRSPALKEGDVVVSGQGGWREYHVGKAAAYERVDPAIQPLSLYLGVLGMTGLTAWVGLLDVARLKDGETVFVSAAAGAVGGTAGQIAKAKGCRVIGSTGSREKVEHLLRDMGFDAAFDYRDEVPRKALKRLCPDGIDVYFDNVGGEQLEAAIGAMRNFGRIAACGAISVYNATAPVPGPRNLNLVIGKRLTISGFLVFDHMDRAEACRRDLIRWLQEGSVTAPETVFEGIERAPDAFIAMLQGKNVGKMVVKLS